MTASQSRQVNQFGWLVSNFTDRVPGVAYSVVVSTDGLLLTASPPMRGDQTEQLAAVAAGLIGLTYGAARCLDGDAVVRTVVEMERGALLLMTIQDGSCLAVLTSPDCSIAQVAYEMTVLVDQVGQILTPELRTHLRASAHQLA